LGSSTQIQELKITWPSGLVETHNNLNANTTISAVEGQGYEVLNIQPSIKVSGCTDPNACNYNPDATLSNDSCEYIPSGFIEGATSSGFNKSETYSYEIGTSSIAKWTVTHGTIVSGNGTNQITVQWGMGENGTISVFESSEGCVSSAVELEVALDIDNIPDNISIARIWNEALLEAIRIDFARPTVHARNLFHTSIALYDAWAILDYNARPYLIGNTVNQFSSILNEFTPDEDRLEAQKKAMSYAAYRLLRHRFKFSPGSKNSLSLFNLIMEQLGYDIDFESVDYTSGNAAALGNYIAETIIEYGKIDGANEDRLYTNRFYEPINPPLGLFSSEENTATGILDPNRWQPLSFRTFIDQSGNQVSGSTPSFLSPEWGNVYPFALLESDKETKQRDSNDYNIYLDPGIPPQLDILKQNSSSDLYKWNFSLVSLWSSHLDPTDGVLWDISPASIGNIDISSMPNSFDGHKDFYDEFNGGDISKGRTINPITGSSYEPQIVPRADYARVLAEFWADGPDSETPPGHWFTILNYVSDHPLFEKKLNGEGAILSSLEWDVKSYFTLGAAMHDAAIAAWSIKGWHDYIRPISAIRYMAELGQSSNESLSNYHVGGIPLIKGYIEIIEEGDDLSGANNENLGKIKVFAWRGHDFIDEAKTDVAGVGWILAKDWWPYQRPSFVTPPFAGYISGHSTFSRAAAEVMTLLTGDEFFPGGIGEFVAKKDEFLVFEKGPSVDVVLQWATYRDASDQTSLSRIWGGIHPPADDLPGRLIGEKIGINTYNHAIPYFSGKVTPPSDSEILLYPNPVINKEIFIANTTGLEDISVYDIQGRLIKIGEKEFNSLNKTTEIKFIKPIASGLYVLKVNNTSRIFIVNNK